MSHLLDYMCKSSGDNEDFQSFMEFEKEMNSLDIPLALDTNELMSSEFFDSVLSMEQEGLNTDLDNDFMSNICSDLEAHSPRSSESGDSVLLGSETSSSTKDDVINIHEVFGHHENSTEQDQIVFNQQPTKLVVQPNTKRIIFTKPINATGHKGNKSKQLVRVQNGNGRSLLLPFDIKNVKKVKIINANDLKLENIKIANNAGFLKKVTKIEKIEHTDDEDIVPTQDSRYPPLNLTSEEKRLLMKEGIRLPSHYPLTKNEEKELKRIRRKIRNKISAQDSRKRKKEYVDKLEEKAKRTAEENEFLKRRLKLLHKQNGKLMEHMRKLQAVLFNTTSTKATPTTCLMIVLFSTLLVCLPNLQLSEKQELGEQQLFAARRALLFNQKGNEEDVNMDEFLVFNKDEEGELENFAEEESENITDNEFANFLSELAKKYENHPMDKNCSGVNGTLGEFCRKYEDEIKNVINSMKEFLETDSSKSNPKEKAFIEPDISDDEDGSDKLSIKEEPPSKRIKFEALESKYQEKTTSDQNLLLNYMVTKRE